MTPFEILMNSLNWHPANALAKGMVPPPTAPGNPAPGATIPGGQSIMESLGWHPANMAADALVKPGGSLLGNLEALSGLTESRFDPAKAPSPFIGDLARMANSFADAPGNLWNTYQENIGQPFTDFVKGPLAGYFLGGESKAAPPEATATSTNTPPRFLAGLGAGGPGGMPGAAVPGATAPGGQPLTIPLTGKKGGAPSENVNKVWSILTTEGGLSPWQAAGVIGRLQQESGQDLNPNAVGDGGISHGIAQWNKERIKRGKNWAKQQGLEWGDVETQARYLVWEGRNFEKDAWGRITGAGDVESAAEGMMFYERPQGFTKENPRAGHGWDNTVRNANTMFSAISGLPPIPPTLPGPPQRGMPAAPDFSGVNQWLDQAAPVPPNMQLLKDAMLSGVLSGGLQGLGSVNMTEPGSFGQGFARMGAGSLAGLGSGQLTQAQAEDAFNQRTQQYALNRAQAAGTEAQAQQQHADAVTGTQFQNATDQYATGNANMQNQFDWTQTVYEALKAGQDVKVLSSTKEGAWVQGPQGLSFIPTGVGTEGTTMGSLLKDQSQAIKNMADALGADHPVVQQMTADFTAQAGNVYSAKNQVIRDLVQVGQAQNLFPEEYQAAVAMADEQVPPNIMADGEQWTRMRNDLITSMLTMTLEARGDDAWLKEAARLGNPLAASLVIGGQEK